MGRRRYVSTDISTDSELNRLAMESDFAALFYSWLIPHAEDDGIAYGDPDKLLFKVLPGRRDKLPEDICAALRMMSRHRLIWWDEANDMVYFPIQSFYKYQSYIPVEKRRTWDPPHLAAKTATNSENFLPSATNSEELLSPAKNAVSPSPSPSFSISPTPTMPTAAMQNIITLWNDACGDVLPKPMKLTADRRKHLNARLSEAEDRTENWWREYFARIRASPGCCGANDKGWKADFDWAIRSETVVSRVLEGKYDNWGRASPAPPRRPREVQVPDDWGKPDAE